MNYEESETAPAPAYATLDEIAHREPVPELWTDKRSRDGHGYTLLYEEYFHHLRLKDIKLLEIGINQGASIIMWLEYFPNAHIYGFDIAPRPRPSHPRYTFVQGDQMNPNNLAKLGLEHGPFDIIIDDGAHTSGAIETSFKCLQAYFKPGGFYCIEDLGATYWPENNTPGFGKHLEHLMMLMDNINIGRGDMEFLHFYKELAIIRRKA